MMLKTCYRTLERVRFTTERRRWICLLVGICLSLSAASITSAQEKAPAEFLALPRCMVSVKDEADIPAQEPGLLITLHVREGAQVTKGFVLAQIDEDERLVQREIAGFEQQVAAEQAESDINIRYSVAATDVAEAEYQAAVEANKKVAGTFPLTEIRRLKLAWHKSALEITQAELEQRVAKLTARAKAGEVKLAETSIRHRRILSPISGEVVQCFKQTGEWVDAGEQVLRVVRFDTLRIEGFVKADDCNPSDLINRPVTVTVQLAHGQQAETSGRVVYIHPFIETGKSYRIWAEVTNRQTAGQWIFLPGQTAAMRIDLRKSVNLLEKADLSDSESILSPPQQE